MADKKSIFEKYKSIDENGEIKKDVPQENQPVEEQHIDIPEAETEKTVVSEEPIQELPVEEVKEADEFSDLVIPDLSFDDEELDEIMKSVSAIETAEENQVEEIVIAEEPEVPVVPVAPTAEETVSEEVPEKPKKVKEPKPKKEKKVKEPKPKKEKKVEGKDENKPEPEPATKKDYLTIVLALVAVVLAVAFVLVKYFPSDAPTTIDEGTTSSEQELASIQVYREGYLRNLVQTDIPDVFYQFSSDYSIQYYQYRDNQMVPVKTTGRVSASVDYGPAKIPVNIDYVNVGGELFGVGLYRADQNPGIPLYNIQLIIFKMTNLPAGYDTDGKALLVAQITDASLLEGDYEQWPESFTLDVNTGKTSRFLKIINRNTDPATGLGADDFCIITNNGYNSATGKIPFFTARDYDVGVSKEDIYVKTGSDEYMLIRDAARRLVIVEGDSVIFMRYTDTGFNILRKENGKESLVFKFTGGTSRCLFAGDYILDKETATLYNLRTGEEKLIVGYKMTSPEVMRVSPDGRYLVVMGAMNNIMDYQVHVFDLETGKYAKYIEKNYSTISGHTKNLSFINDHTVMYMLIDPNRGRECVVLDLSRAFD